MSACPCPDAQAICAITFDLDDTLWDIWPIISQAEERLHGWLRAYYPRIPERFSPLELRQLCVEIAQQRRTDLDGWLIQDIPFCRPPRLGDGLYLHKIIAGVPGASWLNGRLFTELLNDPMCGLG